MTAWASRRAGTYLPALTVIAGTLDLLTFDLAHEKNPLVASNPALAVVGKCSLILAVALWRLPYGTPVRLVAVAVWSLGVVSNLTWRI